MNSRWSILEELHKERNKLLILDSNLNSNEKTKNIEYKPLDNLKVLAIERKEYYERILKKYK